MFGVAGILAFIQCIGTFILFRCSIPRTNDSDESFIIRDGRFHLSILINLSDFTSLS